MSNGNIEVSKDGIKIPYRRYLSDSTPGFILILLLLGFYYDKKLPFLANILPQDNSSEVKIFILFLLFLLATPVGVIINVTGWFFLEVTQKRLEMKIFKNKECIWKLFNLEWFKQEYDLKSCVEKFDIKEKDWFQKVRILEIALVNDFPGKSDGIEVLRGIAILLRSLSLMFAGAFIFYLICLMSTCPIVSPCPMMKTFIAIVFIILSLVFLCLSAVMSFYFHVQILCWAFILRHDEKAKLLQKLIK